MHRERTSVGAADFLMSVYSAIGTSRFWAQPEHLDSLVELANFCRVVFARACAFV